MRHALGVPLGLVLFGLVLAWPASADPGDVGDVGRLFRRTTPRASFDRDAGGLILGIPAGRAWGVESALQPLAGADRVIVTVAVDDPDVSEAFVRVAYYARADQRTRQLATRDSPYVRVGDDRRLSIELDPPPGAVAYRLRVLGRLVPGALGSRRDAIHARWDPPLADGGRPRPSLTRLRTDLP
jgi:hypothetical protein